MACNCGHSDCGGGGGLPNRARWLIVAGLVGLIALALAACAGGPRSWGQAPDLTPALIERGSTRGFPEDSLRRGREVFVAKCAECHALPNPDGYTEREWERILPRMARRARLDDSEARAVRAFVLAVLSERNGAAH